MRKESNHMFSFLQWRFISAAFFLTISWQTLSSAYAKSNDFHLHFLYEGRDEAARQTQQDNFRLLATEFGLALTSPINSPAETLGSAGFDLGFELTLSNVPEESKHWRRAVEDYRPDNQLLISRFRLRKGLPFSFELDGSVGFLYDNSSLIAGVGLKWALNEGFPVFPDVAFRLEIQRLFSSRDLDMTITGGDVWVSKQFSILGMLTLTPYTGYSLIFIRAASNVLDPTPNNFQDNETTTTGNFVFLPEIIFGHRFFFGLRTVWYFVSASIEGVFNFPDKTAYTNETNLPQTIGMFNAKLSFSF